MMSSASRKMIATRIASIVCTKVAGEIKLGLEHSVASCAVQKARAVLEVQVRRIRSVFASLASEVYFREAGVFIVRNYDIKRVVFLHIFDLRTPSTLT